MNRFGREPQQVSLAPGWHLRRIGTSAQLLGANGVRFGPDGRLYIAQAMGSQISALDVDSAAIEVVVPVGGGIFEPDDLAFDRHGTIYATEIMEGRVGARMPNGQTRVIADQLIAVNGISIHEDRIFADEFRPGGRMWELYPDGRSPRLIAENLPAPNALSLGADGYLYFPTVFANEIWRVPVGGGEAERFIGGLSRPVAVKFDSKGNLFAANSRTGEIVKIDAQSRTFDVVARTRSGNDNFAFGPDDRLFISHFIDGGVSEAAAGGRERVIVPPALVGPWGLCFDREGSLIVADGISLARLGANGTYEHFGTLVTDRYYPGILRNVAVRDDGSYLIVNSSGELVAYEPECSKQAVLSGLGQIMGFVQLPGDIVVACDYEAGELVAAEPGGTRIVARGLGKPTGIALGSNGTLFVCDASEGRILTVEKGEIRLVADGLVEPHGITIVGAKAYVLDRAMRQVHQIGLDDGSHLPIAIGLPVGAGSSPERIMPGMFGLDPRPILPFSGLTSDPSGKLYISADGDGSVWVLSHGMN